MKILKNLALVAINLCSSSNAIENQITLSNGEHGIDSNIKFNATTSIQAYGSLERLDTSKINSIQPEYIRIASLFETENIRFCMQPRSNASPPVRIVTKPCGDSEEQLFYVDTYGFLRWSLNRNMCLMRFATPENQAVMVLDNCENSKFQEKIVYSSFDGAILIGRKSANLRAATFEGKVPKRNIVIKMRKRDYDSPGQLWKIEHVSTSSLYPSSDPTMFPTTTAPTVSSPTVYPTSTLSIKPSVVPTSTPSAEPSVVPSADLLL